MKSAPSLGRPRPVRRDLPRQGPRQWLFASFASAPPAIPKRGCASAPRGGRRAVYQRSGTPAMTGTMPGCRSSLRARSWSSAFRKELSTPAAGHLLDLIAALSKTTNLSVGCYCENEARCHRSVLRTLLEERGADLA